MLIRIRFFGDLKEYLLTSQTTLEISQGSSLHDFIFELAKNRDPTLLRKLMEKDNVHSGITILVNGRNIVHLNGLKTELNDRDLISILPIAGGG